MDNMIYAKAFFALIFVASLIGICGVLLRKLNIVKDRLEKKDNRLKILEKIQITKESSLALIKKDDNEYLILSNLGNAQLIEKSPSRE